MLIRVSSIAHVGLDPIGVDIEINMASRGLPSFDIVGLGNKAVEESKERVRTAMVNAGVEFPMRRVTVNMAPADVPKEGSCYDFPIAAGIIALLLRRDLPPDSLFFGELSLDGSLRHTKGALLLALFAKSAGFKRVFVPQDSANEASIVRGVEVYPVAHLSQFAALLQKTAVLDPAEYREEGSGSTAAAGPDMAEIIGQEQAKRAAEIAAAGGHNLLMVGSPGSGKTLLARAMPGILPPLTEEESLEVTKIYSIAGKIPAGGNLVRERPFRAPHHTVSLVGLIGGGVRPSPGEITLANRGILFLDEINEFPRAVLESLRQPLEDGILAISRNRARAVYPSRVMLVASANPCPCGFLLHTKKPCVCTPREVQKYRKRLSGPLLDRIDLHVEVPDVEVKKLAGAQAGEKSRVVRERVLLAWEIQQKRFANEAITYNAEMRNEHIRRLGCLSSGAESVLVRGAESFQLSARSYFKMIKIARTIGDLAGAELIEPAHMAEALQYRPRTLSP